MVSEPPATALGPDARPARREERGVLDDEYASDEQRRGPTQMGPATCATNGLRRQQAVSGVAPPRSTTVGTASSSLLGFGLLALATRLARGFETNSNLRRAITGVALAVLLALGAPATAEAAFGRGLGYLLAGLVEIPRSVLVGTVTGPPILGTAFGAVGGVMRTAGLLLGGTLEILGTAIPVAAKAAPAVLPFVL